MLPNRACARAFHRAFKRLQSVVAPASCLSLDLEAALMRRTTLWLQANRSTKAEGSPKSWALPVPIG